jgi:hypothetical protein
MITPQYFYDLLDCLAGQFFSTRYAICTGLDFGVNISRNAKEYFSVAVIQDELQGDMAVRGVLIDDSAHVPGRNGFTFAIYIDPTKFEEKLFELISTIIIAHEICHFVSYYEIFLELGDDIGSTKHSYFTNIVSYELIEALTSEHDSTSQTLFDGHDINDLLNNLKRFPKEHFSRKRETKINYLSFLNSFLQHLKFDDMLKNYKNN